MLKKLKNEKRVGRGKDLGKKITLKCAQIVVMALKILSQYPLQPCSHGMGSKVNWF